MARILLIEDDELMRDTVTQFLELDGHSVVTAEDGEAGLARLNRDVRPHLVITDILMPRMDGARAIVEIRKVDPAVPILAISGGRRQLSPQFSLGTASLVGASEQLSKPFTRAQLQAAVSRALGSQGTR